MKRDHIIPLAAGQVRLVHLDVGPDIGAGSSERIEHLGRVDLVVFMDEAIPQTRGCARRSANDLSTMPGSASFRKDVK